MRVLVTDGTMKKALAVVRAISDEASTIGVSSQYFYSTACLSRHADLRHRVPDRSPDALVARYNEIISTHEYDYLLPVGGQTFEIVSARRDDLHVPLHPILPSHDALMTAIRKAQTYAAGERGGIPVAPWASLTSSADLEKTESTVGFPAVLKTGVETEPRFVEVVRSLKELRDAYAAYTRNHESDPIVQSFLPGESRGCFCLFLNGRLAGWYTHRRIREFPPRGGASACAQSELDEELRQYSEDLLTALDWHGVAMVEFKEDSGGTPHLIEINPKFWGSLDLGVASGMNFPAALLSYASEEDSFEFGFRPRRVHWPLSGDLFHAIKRPSSAPAVFRDLASPGTRSNIRWDDPIPHLLEGVINAVSSAKR